MKQHTRIAIICNKSDIDTIPLQLLLSELNSHSYISDLFSVDNNHKKLTSRQKTFSRLIKLFYCLEYAFNLLTNRYIPRSQLRLLFGKTSKKVPRVFARFPELALSIKDSECTFIIDLINSKIDFGLPKISISYDFEFSKIGFNEVILHLEQIRVILFYNPLNKIGFTDFRKECNFLNRKGLFRSHYFSSKLLSAYIVYSIENPFHSALPNSVEPQFELTIDFTHFTKYIYSLFVDFLSLFYRKKGSDWHLAFYPNNWLSRLDSEITVLQNPSNSFLADPFLFEIENELYCFAELFDFSTSKGRIVSAKVDQFSTNWSWKDEITENFHLSFPFIFKYQDDFYMCPETSEIQEIRIYKYDKKTLKWNYYKTLMNNVRAADTLIFFKNGKWWLFCTLDLAQINEYETFAFLWYSDNPFTSHWVPHNLNPVFIDSNKARNAGLLYDKDEIYRVSQSQGQYTYGKSFDIHRIKIINEMEFTEVRLKDQICRLQENIEATHHFSSFGNFSIQDVIAMSYKEQL